MMPPHPEAVRRGPCGCEREQCGQVGSCGWDGAVYGKRGQMAYPMMTHHKRCGKFFGMIFLMMAIVNILVAIWVYQDIRARNTGSGIWIVVALLSGLLGTAVYALVRIGDTKK